MYGGGNVTAVCACQNVKCLDSCVRLDLVPYRRGRGEEGRRGGGEEGREGGREGERERERGRETETEERGVAGREGEREKKGGIFPHLHISSSFPSP